MKTPAEAFALFFVTSDRLTEVGASMNELQLGLVQYDVLQNPRGHLALLAALVNEELEAQEAM